MTQNLQHYMPVALSQQHGAHVLDMCDHAERRCPPAAIPSAPIATDVVIAACMTAEKSRDDVRPILSVLPCDCWLLRHSVLLRQMPWFECAAETLAIAFLRARARTALKSHMTQ